MRAEAGRSASRRDHYRFVAQPSPVDLTRFAVLLAKTSQAPESVAMSWPMTASRRAASVRRAPGGSGPTTTVSNSSIRIASSSCSAVMTSWAVSWVTRRHTLRSAVKSSVQPPSAQARLSTVSSSPRMKSDIAASHPSVRVSNRPTSGFRPSPATRRQPVGFGVWRMEAPGMRAASAS